MPTPTYSPLVCLPFGGAGLSFYQSWKKLGFDNLEILPIQLPGRERRIMDAPFTDLRAAATALSADILERANGRDVSLFGHCYLGSALAYEIAHQMLDRHPDSVRRLVVSASRVPSKHPNPVMARLSDDELVEHVKAITGYSHPALDIPEMRDLILPTLRSDFVMDETYVPRHERKLPIPITAIAATSDDLYSVEQVSGWADYTDASFELWEVDGGHMYLASDPGPMVARLVSRMKEDSAELVSHA